MSTPTERRVVTFSASALTAAEVGDAVDKQYREWQANQEQLIETFQEHVSQQLVALPNGTDAEPRWYVGLTVIYSLHERPDRTLKQSRAQTGPATGQRRW